jgi:hypothetical protein
VPNEQTGGQSFSDSAIEATKTAGLYGLIRGLFLTPLVEVPFTNLERQRQLHLQIHNSLPKSAIDLVADAHRANRLSVLFTGASTNMTKNFLREMVKSYTWLSVPLISHYVLQNQNVHECGITKVATTTSVILVNGTMNAIFDGIRNMQIDAINLHEKRLTSSEAALSILRTDGPLGFFKGGASTYLYSFAFWGSFALSRRVYSNAMEAAGMKPDENLRDQCILNAASGATSGFVTMPLEHIRYRVIGGGDLPTALIPAFRKFHINHFPKLGIRAYYCGLSQSMPIQISAGLLAGTLLFMQRKKSSINAENVRD